MWNSTSNWEPSAYDQHRDNEERIVIEEYNQKCHERFTPTEEGEQNEQRKNITVQ